jgi:hypothetical protein
VTVTFGDIHFPAAFPRIRKWVSPKVTVTVILRSPTGEVSGVLYGDVGFPPAILFVGVSPHKISSRDKFDLMTYASVGRVSHGLISPARKPDSTPPVAAARPLPSGPCRLRRRRPYENTRNLLTTTYDKHSTFGDTHFRSENECPQNSMQTTSLF